MHFYFESGVKIDWIIELRIEAFTPYLFYMKISSFENNISNQMLEWSYLWLFTFDSYHFRVFTGRVHFIETQFICSAEMSANTYKVPNPVVVSVKHLFIFSDPSGTNNSCLQEGSERIIDLAEDLNATPRRMNRIKGWKGRSKQTWNPKENSLVGLGFRCLASMHVCR